MPKLTMTKGLPASGKTTWAKQQNAKRINKDDLRAMIDNGVWSKQNEKLVLQARDALISIFMSNGFDVIVDDTNLAPYHEQELQNYCVDNDFDFEIKDFTDVSLEECIARDKKRPNYVGEDVIRTMYNSFLKQKPNVVKYIKPPHDPNLKDCIIVDIDGTLAHMTGRSPYDYSKVHTDVVDETVRDIVNLYSDDGYYVVVVSGREDSCKQETVDWLNDNEVEYDAIYMRQAKDVRNDAIVKREIYEEHIKPNFNVLFVLDDRDRVVKMWREQGLKVLQVAEGDF